MSDEQTIATYFLQAKHPLTFAVRMRAAKTVGFALEEICKHFERRMNKSIATYCLQGKHPLTFPVRIRAAKTIGVSQDQVYRHSEPICSRLHDIKNTQCLAKKRFSFSCTLLLSCASNRSISWTFGMKLFTGTLA